MWHQRNNPSEGKEMLLNVKKIPKSISAAHGWRPGSIPFASFILDNFWKKIDKEEVIYNKFNEKKYFINKSNDK